jgi:hypothetical protein
MKNILLLSTAVGVFSLTSGAWGSGQSTDEKEASLVPLSSATESDQLDPLYALTSDSSDFALRIVQQYIDQGVPPALSTLCAIRDMLGSSLNLPFSPEQTRGLVEKVKSLWTGLREDDRQNIFRQRTPLTGLL